MLKALLAFGFDSLRLERIELDVYDFNEGAHRLYRRVGFVDEGVARHRIFREGRYRDLYKMSILRRRVASEPRTNRPRTRPASRRSRAWRGP